MKVSLSPALPRQLVAALASSSSRGRRNKDGLASPFAKLISRQERKSENRRLTSLTPPPLTHDADQGVGALPACRLTEKRVTMCLQKPAGIAHGLQ